MFRSNEPKELHFFGQHIFKKNQPLHMNSDDDKIYKKNIDHDKIYNSVI
jgi:hypothetical protein